jgi:hypothetical protein
MREKKKRSKRSNGQGRGLFKGGEVELARSQVKMHVTRSAKQGGERERG